MSEEIRTGLLQDVRDLDGRAISASAADGTDGGGAMMPKKDHDAADKSDADGTDTDSDAKDRDSDGTDAGDSDGTDAGDADGTDKGDSDGTDNA
jgi:hypothetical protein